MDKFNQMLRSRKFWALLIGLVVLFVGESAGVDQEQLTNATYLIVSFILGVGLEAKKA